MLTEIALILDRSGSMQSMKSAAIEAFNAFLADQQQIEGLTRLTLVLFDHEITTVYDALPVSEIPALREDTYIPRGSTALLDAIGLTVDQLGERFANTPDEQKPGHVSVAILTDGEENSSTRYRWQDIANRISHQTDKYQWEFLFLGAGVDAIATASKLNIPAQNSSAYIHDHVGYAAASLSLSRKIRGSRAYKSGDHSEHTVNEKSLSLGQIFQEEDKKRRQP